uniref:Uncharacterized protein n=1 Tax=Rhizophora mucronata TaxID=61149 RepID=A0A2P2NAE0_RHIMU
MLVRSYWPLGWHTDIRNAELKIKLELRSGQLIQMQDPWLPNLYIRNAKI